MEIIHKARLSHGLASIFMEWVFLCRYSVTLPLLKSITRCIVSMMANMSLLLFALGPEQIRFTNIFCESINFWIGNDGSFTCLLRKQFIQTVRVLLSLQTFL